MKRSYQELAAENRRLRAKVARLTVKLEATTDRLRAEVEALDSAERKADAWVRVARDKARELGLPDDESRSSTHDWAFICRQIDRLVTRAAAADLKIAAHNAECPKNWVIE